MFNFINRSTNAKSQAPLSRRLALSTASIALMMLGAVNASAQFDFTIIGRPQNFHQMEINLMRVLRNVLSWEIQ